MVSLEYFIRDIIKTIMYNCYTRIMYNNVYATIIHE